MDDNIISFRGVSKAFGDVVVYEDLCLDIRRGETLTIIGGSGVGKSVCLKMLIGLMTTDTGTIHAFGDEVGTMNAKGLLKLRSRIAMLFQGAALFDFVLIDCPPSLNMLTVNAMVACDSILITMQCEYFALEGLSALLNTIRRINETVNPDLEIEGILRTMYDPRNSLTTEVSEQLFSHFGDLVYRTVIPRNVRLAEAPSHGEPGIVYDRYSRGARAYMALAEEFIRRQ